MQAQVFGFCAKLNAVLDFCLFVVLWNVIMQLLEKKRKDTNSLEFFNFFKKKTKLGSCKTFH